MYVSKLPFLTQISKLLRDFYGTLLKVCTLEIPLISTFDKKEPIKSGGNVARVVAREIRK